LLLPGCSPIALGNCPAQALKVVYGKLSTPVNEKPPTMTNTPQKSRKGRKLFIILGSLFILLVALHLVLPYFLLKYVNRQLTLIDGYTGHVDDIDVALYRGAYTIKSIHLDKKSGKVPVPFFKADVIDLSVEWKALFNGRIVAEIDVNRPVLNFVKGPSAATSQTDIDNDWTVVVDKLIPFKLNRFTINDGEIHFKDFHSNPKVNIKATNLQVLAQNLTNAKHVKEKLPSTVTASAAVYDGEAKLDMKIDPLMPVPTFDMNARLTTLNITKLNDFLQAYGNFDAEKGTISMYCEAAAKDKKITGYVKPIIKDLKVVSWKEDKDNLGKVAWESVVGAVAWLLNNKPKDQIATRASFTGNIDNPDVNLWSIIGQLLRNAFIQALFPALENSVNLNAVDKKEEKKGLLGRIFDGKDNKEKGSDKKEKEKK
jgi:hypothetical protein